MDESKDLKEICDLERRAPYRLANKRFRHSNYPEEPKPEFTNLKFKLIAENDSKEPDGGIVIGDRAAVGNDSKEVVVSLFPEAIAKIREMTVLYSDLKTIEIRWSYVVRD